MNIKSIKISNILSIETAELIFNSSGLMLVSGWNHDSGRANGAGKTAIFNALTFALYDKLPRKITASEILRRGSKTGYCEVAINVGDDLYVVNRSRPKGASFSKNGIKIDLTQEEWENTLRLSYSQFLTSAYCSQGTSARFLSLNDSDKKQFLLQLLNLEEFASCKQLADTKAKLLEEERKATQAKISSIESKIEAYRESLIDEEECATIIKHNEDLISALQTEMASARQVPKPDTSKFQKLEDDIANKKLEQSRAKLKREMLHEQYRKIKSKVRPFDKKDVCGACGTRLDTSSAKAAHAKEMVDLDSEALRLKTEIDACDDIIVKEAEVNDLASKLKDKKKKITKDYELASLKIVELEGKMAIARKNIEDTNVKLSCDSELRSKINTLTMALTKCSLVCTNLNKEIDIYKTIATMYSSTGAQAYVLDSVIDSFNYKVNNYVNLLWPNMTYQLLSYKENLKGDMSAKFSEQLTMDGKPISIGSLSGGEYRALSLCIDFALINVMESQFGIHVSPITLDEPFDGLDAAGRELILSLLENMSLERQIIVIDHASEVAASFSNVCRVEKRDGISTVLMIV